MPSQNAPLKVQLEHWVSQINYSNNVTRYQPLPEELLLLKRFKYHGLGTSVCLTNCSWTLFVCTEFFNFPWIIIQEVAVKCFWMLYNYFYKVLFYSMLKAFVDFLAENVIRKLQVQTLNKLLLINQTTKYILIVSYYGLVSQMNLILNLLGKGVLEFMAFKGFCKLSKKVLKNTLYEFEFRNSS